MAFNYTPLTETQKLKDMYPKVNDIGNFLKTEVNLSDLKAISQPDFNNILDKIPDSGNYYVTTSKNQPLGENWNGFVRLDKRNTSYYKIYYSPFNSNKIYTKTYANGTVYDWISFKLDEGNLYNEGNTLNVKELTESTIQYATLVNPPKENLNKGWVNYKESKNGVSSLVEFNPVNSTSTFKMIRKLPVQEQNPNLLKDTLFNETQYNLKPWDSRTSNWKWDTTFDSDVTVNKDITLNNQKSIRITNNKGSKYPIIRSRGLEVGKDVTPGDTLTFSAYLYVTDLSAMKDNNFYLAIAKYTEDLADVNNSVSTVNFNADQLKEREWQRLTLTFTVPPTSEAKYIACAMRISNNKSGTGTGMTGYYALPKLEKGNKATPFITNKDDKVQFDTIWSNWIDIADENTIKNNYTSDINKDNYFKYAWFKDDVNGMSLKDLIMTVPQGFHTFYCQGTIDGTPRNRSIRGTIQVDYDKGDANLPNKFINVNLTDTEGVPYSLYYGGINKGWNPLKEIRTSVILWEGNLDLGSTETVPLKDDWHNYEYIELFYWSESAGHIKSTKMDVTSYTSPNVYVRDFNLTNNSTGSGVDFFEGYIQFPSNTSANAGMAKKVTLDGSTNTTSVSGFNVQSILSVKKIIGINSL